MTVISYPIPQYQNLPIQPQNYQPSQFFISDISLGQTTVVTTTVNHNYVLGQQVRLLIPFGFGCSQLNEQSAFVVSIPADNQVEINLYSQYADPFKSNTFFTQPQIVAIGEINTGNVNSQGRNNTATFIPGSFTNISY